MVGSAAAVEAAGRRARAGGSEEDRHYYTWLEDYLATLEGKEAREEYYARLEYDPGWLRGVRPSA